MSPWGTFRNYGKSASPGFPAAARLGSGGMDTTGGLLPKAVRRLAESVREAGFEPGVRRLGGEWEVFVAGEHVRASAFFRVKPGSPRTRYLRSALLVDGVAHPTAATFGELHDIWDEHELGLRQEESLLEVTDPGHEAVPAAIRHIADSVRQQSGGQLDPRCGRAGRKWAIAIDFGPGTGLRIIFEWAARAWRMPARNPVQLFIDGEDRASEAEGKIEKAMALLATRAYPADGASAPGVAASPGARDNGVETRKLVVKRQLLRLHSVPVVHGNSAREVRR